MKCILRYPKVFSISDMSVASRERRVRKEKKFFSPDDYKVPRVKNSKCVELDGARRRNSKAGSHLNIKSKWDKYKLQFNRAMSMLRRNQYNLDVFNQQDRQVGSNALNTITTSEYDAYLPPSPNPAISAAEAFTLASHESYCVRSALVAKLTIRRLLQAAIDENHDDVRYPELGLSNTDGNSNPESELDNMIDIEHVLCSRCGKEDTEGNDILLCDRVGCNRAYHQLCLDVPLAIQSDGCGDGVSDNPSDIFFCWQCEFLDDVYAILTDYMEGATSTLEVCDVNCLADVFPEVAHLELVNDDEFQKPPDISSCPSAEVDETTVSSAPNPDFSCNTSPSTNRKGSCRAHYSIKNTLTHKQYAASSIGVHNILEVVSQIAAETAPDSASTSNAAASTVSLLKSYGFDSGSDDEDEDYIPERKFLRTSRSVDTARDTAVWGSSDEEATLGDSMDSEVDMTDDELEVDAECESGQEDYEDGVVDQDELRYLYAESGLTQEELGRIQTEQRMYNFRKVAKEQKQQAQREFYFENLPGVHNNFLVGKLIGRVKGGCIQLGLVKKYYPPGSGNEVKESDDEMWDVSFKKEKLSAQSQLPDILNQTEEVMKATTDVVSASVQDSLVQWNKVQLMYVLPNLFTIPFLLK